MAVLCKESLTASWSGLKGGEANLSHTFILADVGRISLTDLQAGNINCNQEYKLWKDEQNKFGTTIKLQYTDAFPFLYNTLASGVETVLVQANTNPLVDRPVTVTGQPFDIHSKNSMLLLAASNLLRIIYLYDDNIIFDNYDPKNPADTLPKPLSLALNNALFKVTPVNGCLLFGELKDDWVKVEKGVLYLTFGLYAYLPTLPDPYAANINKLKYQFRGSKRLTDNDAGSATAIWAWLVSQTIWNPDNEENDKVEVSFHFAPLQNQFQISANTQQSENANINSSASNISSEIIKPAVCKIIYF